MLIYIILLISILLLPILSYGKAGAEYTQKKRKEILAFSLILVFLIFALRDFSVGRDILGYESMYRSFQNASRNHFDLYWTEWGYELLEYVFSAILHFPFRIFLSIIYAFIFISYYRFIVRYSNDYVFSLLIYICFTFMAFDMSALRNSFALAIYLFAIPFAQKNGIKNFLIYCSIVVLATQIHRSAIVCFILYFVIRYKLSMVTIAFYAIFPILIFSFKDFIAAFLGYDLSGNALYVGGGLVFYIFNVLFSLFLDLNHNKKTLINTNLQEAQSSRTIDNISMSTRLLYVTSVLQIFSSGSVLSRLSSFSSFMVITLLPNNVSRLYSRDRLIVKLIIYAFLIWYFCRYTLIGNGLDIVPYVFFWNG